jgi:hypothetical protein
MGFFLNSLKEERQWTGNGNWQECGSEVEMAKSVLYKWLYINLSLINLEVELATLITPKGTG